MAKLTLVARIRRGIKQIVLFLFFYFSLSPAFAIASTNVALATNGGQVIAFSKQFDSRGYAAYLIDGKKQFNVAYTGWWVKYPTGTQYATLQFNNTYTIDKINHFNDGQYGAKAVTIKYSLDNTTWQTLGTYTGLTVTSSKVNLNTFSFSPIQAKYLKFEYTSFNNSTWLQIDEVEALTAELALPDTTPPTGTIKINNDAQYTNSTAVTLNLTAQDEVGGSGLSQMQFSNDNTTWSTPEAYATAKAWILTAGDGAKTVYVKYKDVAGNWSSAYSDTIILDTAPPTVSITSPLNNATLSGTVDLQATASDNVGVTKVAFYLDTTLLAEDITSPYSYSLNSTLYANGTHTLKAVTSDSAGNSQEAVISVNISNQIQTSTNVALSTNGGQVIAFSKQFDSRGYAAYLIDGKKQFNVAYTGWWVKAPTGTQYATLQFNNTYTIDKINHFNDGQYGAKAVTIKYSLDNVTWQTLGTYTGLTVTSSRVNQDTFSFSPIQTKYLKFEYTSFNSSSWLQIDEVEVWGSGSLLSISVNPKEWNIANASVSEVITMNQANKIMVVNDGTGPETFELKLINPLNWIASTIPGEEKYVLSGLFCNSTDMPQANNFNQDNSTEDVITAQSVKSTNTVFGYSQATANGVAVPAGGIRSLYLQFKSPAMTQRTDEQNISVIITCQVP